MRKTVIKATVKIKREGFPQVLYFDTDVQADAENVMTAMDIGSSGYYFTLVTVDEKLVWPTGAEG